MQTVTVKNSSSKALRYTVPYDTSDSSAYVETFDLQPGEERTFSATTGSFKVVKVENAQ